MAVSYSTVLHIKCHVGVSDLASNLTNIRLFKISFLFILAQKVLLGLNEQKRVLKRPTFVQFGDNLDQLEAKSDIPVCHVPKDQ